MTRILVVDDEPELLEVLREHFEGRYEVRTALSGAAPSSASCGSDQTWFFSTSTCRVPTGSRC